MQCKQCEATAMREYIDQDGHPQTKALCAECWRTIVKTARLCFAYSFGKAIPSGAEPAAPEKTIGDLEQEILRLSKQNVLKMSSEERSRTERKLEAAIAAWCEASWKNEEVMYGLACGKNARPPEAYRGPPAYRDYDYGAAGPNSRSKGI